VITYAGYLADPTVLAPLANDVAPIIDIQGPTNAPQPDALSVGTNLLLPARPADEQFGHFPEEMYDLRSTSHIYRFLMAMLGEAGVGGLLKRYQVARLQADIAGTHFFDLDRFYGALFGFRRLSTEQFAVDPMTQVATPTEWADIMAKDASYRSRIIDFSKAIALGPTYDGIQAAAHSIVSAPVEIYESWMLYDENAYTPGGAPIQVGARTWGDVEQTFPFYRSVEGQAYGSLDGAVANFGNPPSNGPVRNQFIVQPRRPVSLEETYEIQRVLSRLKPADQIMVVDAGGIAIHAPVTGMRVAADSSYWEVTTKVVPKAKTSSGAGTPYLVTDQGGIPQTLPSPPFSAYQGEAWSYNSDIVSITAYAETATTPYETLVTHEYERQYFADGGFVDHVGNRALLPPRTVASARAAGEGVLVASPYTGSRAAVRT
jgi:hypothetical protein